MDILEQKLYLKQKQNSLDLFDNRLNNCRHVNRNYSQKMTQNFRQKYTKQKRLKNEQSLDDIWNTSSDLKDTKYQEKGRKRGRKRRQKMYLK